MPKITEEMVLSYLFQEILINRKRCEFTKCRAFNVFSNKWRVNLYQDEKIVLSTFIEYGPKGLRVEEVEEEEEGEIKEEPKTDDNSQGEMAKIGM